MTVKGGTEAMRKEREISRRLFLAALGEDGATRMQVIASAGISSSTFRRILNEYREQNIVRICGWILRRDDLTGERKPGIPFAVYGLNPDGLPDAKRPKQIPKNKVVQKYHAKKRVVRRAKALARDGKPNMFDQLRYAA